jgi:glutathione reductase (NADPH)
VPKKFMVYASEFSHTLDLAEGYGWSHGEASFDWPKFMTAKDVEIARLSGIYATNLAKAGADLIHDRATFVDAHTLQLAKDGRQVTADKILIAVGGRPWMPSPEQIPGMEHAISSDEAFHLEEAPKRVLIAGGGYIAVEFAGIFNGLGAETTIVYRGPNILRGFDEDVRVHLADELERRGIRVILGAQHERLEKTNTGIVHHLTNGITCETDVAMFAVGRRPHTAGLGLNHAGVQVNENGAVVVDAYSQTTQPNIYAVGDVTDRVNLTPVAIREAQAFNETVFRNNPTAYDHEMIPTAVFSQPPVGSVGLTEPEARRKYHGEVDIYLARFRPMKTIFVGKDERVLMKLIVERGSEKIVGCHIVGPDSPEMIQMAAIAVKMGVTKSQWDSTCALHPTVAEEIVTMREKYTPPELAAAE